MCTQKDGFYILIRFRATCTFKIFDFFSFQHMKYPGLGDASFVFIWSSDRSAFIRLIPNHRGCQQCGLILHRSPIHTRSLNPTDSHTNPAKQLKATKIKLATSTAVRWSLILHSPPAAPVTDLTRWLAATCHRRRSLPHQPIIEFAL